MPEQALVLGQRELDGLDRIEVVRGRGDMPGMLELADSSLGIQRSATSRPRSSGKSQEVQLPDLVGAGRRDQECAPCGPRRAFGARPGPDAGDRTRGICRVLGIRVNVSEESVK